MFDNLKDQIRKENLQLIRKKSRYIEHQIQKTHQQIKSNQSKPMSHNIRGALIIQKQGEQNDNYSMSSDSLSDYELQQREQMFNLLIQKDTLQQKGCNQQQRWNESSPVYKRQAQFKIFSQKYFTPQTKINQYFTPQTKVSQYFTPQSKIRQLQRTVQLSEQKLKLTEQSHLRQIQSLNHKHSLDIQEMNLKIQKLQLFIRQQQNKRQRMNEVYKQNRQLKQTLQVYEQKYWKYDQVSSLLNKTQQQKQKLTIQNNQITIQNNQLKNYLQSAQTLYSHSNKQNKLQAVQLKQSENNSQQDKLRIRQLQRQVLRLQSKVSQLQKQSQIQQIHNQQIINNYQLKIQHLQNQLNNKNKTIRQSQLTIQKLNEEKDKLQRSLLFTMDSFSKHLANQSTHYSQYIKYSPQHIKHQHIRHKYTKYSPQHIRHQYHIRQIQTQSSLQPVYKIHQQQTINLDLNQSLPNHTHPIISKPQMKLQRNTSPIQQQKPYNQLNSISPMPIKNTQNYQNTTQYLSHHDYLKNQTQNTSIKQSIQQDQRSRIMSHQPPHNKHKLSKFIALQNPSYQTQIHNNPQQQHSQQSKITKLQRKLQIANLKIVELLKQKLLKGTKLTFFK